MDAMRGGSLEARAREVTDRLLKKAETGEIGFTFRTANNSVYVGDRNFRTTRYRAASNSFESPSQLTVYLDHKYLDDCATPRSSEQYLPNSPLIHDRGMIILHNPGKVETRQIKTFEDLPENIDLATLKESLFFVIYDRILQKAVKKAPVSILPQKGHHPIEFCDPATHPQQHNNHFGNMIEDLTFTNRKPESDVKKAVENLVRISLGKKSG